MTPSPYDYPREAHVRKHGPEGFKVYEKYRPWLRDEFSFRCVYCLERETWSDMRVAMHIDHLIPQTTDPKLICEYSNLLYLCPNCNILKRKRTLLDPCVKGLGTFMRVKDDGSIEIVTGDTEVEHLIEILALNEPEQQERRRHWIGIIRSLAKYDRSNYLAKMGYPNDLPNLAEPSLSPPSNSKPEGIANSHWELRRKGILPEIY